MPTRRSWIVLRNGWRGWVVKLKFLFPVRQGALARWAVLGFFVLLCGAWVLPSNKLYHQLIILFLWLPALLALFQRNFRLLLVQSGVSLGLLALWTFSSVSLMTDGIGLWLKPNADWLITWLPISLAMVLASRQIAGMGRTARVKTEL